MYPISTAGRTAFLEGQMQEASITLEQGTASDVSITNADILDLVIDRYSTAKSDLEIGNVSAAELTLSLLNIDGAFDSVSWKNHELTVEMTCGGVTVPMGVFIVDSVPKRQEKLTITALDRMVLFDRYVDWTGYTFPMTAAAMVQAICTTCGVTLSSSVDLTTLPNYSYSISASPASEDMTWRQILSWLCEIMGVNAYMDWNGELRLGWYTASGETFDDSLLISGEIAESELSVTGVKIVLGGTEFVAGDSGSAITISGNLLLADNLQTVVDNIYTAIGNTVYAPFTATTLPMVHLYPGDTITYVDDSVSKTCAITNVTFGQNYNTAFKGKGRDVADDETASVGSFTSSQSAEINNISKRVADTNNHFWADGEGIHVTYGDGTATTGNNVLIDSDSLDIRDGETVLASFGAETRIGQTDSSGVGFTATDTTFYDTDGVEAGVISQGAQVVKNFGQTINVIYDSSTEPPTTLTYEMEHTVALSAGAMDVVLATYGASIGTFHITAADTVYTLTAYGHTYTAQYISADNTIEITQPHYYEGYLVSDIWIRYYGYGAAPTYAFGVGTATGEYAFSEGRGLASGASSHAEGYGTASGTYAHAEGASTVASGARSHAQNQGTVAASTNQTALGQYNVEDTNDEYAVIVGNGTSSSNRSNALTVDWSGNAEVAGDITDGNGNVLSEKADSNDLADYLPLSGGTLTGSLNGTEATFTDDLTADRLLPGDITIASGADLNDITYSQRGWYRCNGTIGQTLSHHPVSGGTGYLRMFAHGTGDPTSSNSVYSYQIAFYAASRVFVRRLYWVNGSVTDPGWTELANVAALADYLPLAGGTLTGALSGTEADFSGDLIAARLISGYTSIASGADLNAEVFYLIGKQYQCNSATIAQSLSNCPTSTYFVMYCNAWYMRDAGDTSGSSVNTIRTIIDNVGKVYIQKSSRNSSGTWTHGTWITIDERLNNANALATVTPIEITSLTNGSVDTSRGGCWYYKIGTRVHAHIAVTGITASSWVAITTLPAGYRPYSIIIGSAWANYTSGTPILCIGRITDGGVVQGMTKSSSGTLSLDFEYDAFS